MATKLLFAILCVAVASATARELTAARPVLSIASLPAELQELNAR